MKATDERTARGQGQLFAGTGTRTAPIAALPAYRTRLIGREIDLARIGNLLVDHRHRLVVVTGPGGVGKTRLAVQAATDLARHYRHGVLLLPLAAVTPGADLDAVVARYLGFRDARHRSHRDTIARYFALREVLVVVDNAESAPEIASLLTYLHARCPGVTFLVTSRSELQIYGEVIHELLPLPHHAPGPVALAAGIGIASLRYSPTVELLHDRVQELDPSFAISHDNAADIAAICDRLGGLPLAIELTAPRLAGRDAATLLAEMTTTGGPQSRVEAALRISVRISYQQLTPDQQRVFRALCIMCGWWLLDDVLPILVDGDEIDAIDHLDALVRRSLLISVATDEEVRFSVTPVLRQIGLRMLAELREDAAAARRHAERMIQLAEEAEPELTGPEQRWWLIRLESLYDDMQDAHTHLLDHGRPVDALRLAAALWRFGYTRGHYLGIRRMIEAALARVDGEDALRSHALNGIGALARMLRDHEGARVAHGQAIEIAEALRLDREIAAARIGLAELDATVAGDIRGALRNLEQAEAICERLHDAHGMATVLLHRGYIAWLRGDLDEALPTLEAAGTLYAEARDTRGMACARGYAGRIAARQGRYHEAATRLLAALEGYEHIGDAAGIAEVLDALAAIAIGTHDLEQASTLLGAAAATRASIGATPSGLERTERDATLAAAREDPGHEAAHARGLAMTLDEAIALARSFPPPPRALDMHEARRRAQELFGITRREHDVLRLLAMGLSNKEVADRLALSIRTVHTHTASLLHKLGVRSRTAAAGAAHQAGIVPARHSRKG